MAKKMKADDGQTETTDDGKRVLPNVQARQACVQEGFEERLKIDRQLAALEEQHLKPLKEVRRKLKKNMSADTGIDSTDLENLYRLYKRQEEAKTMEEDDRDRILENMRDGFNYLKAGEMLNFVTVLEEAA